MVDTDIAYAAGIIDGEGCLRIKKVNPYKCQKRKTPGYHAVVHVRMVETAAVDFLASLFGGTSRGEKPHTKAGRPLHCWTVSDLAAEKALLILLPFLKVKRRQAETLLSLRSLQRKGQRYRTKITGYRNFPNAHGTYRLVPNFSFSDEYVGMCEKMFQACKKLNRTGLAALED